MKWKYGPRRTPRPVFIFALLIRLSFGEGDPLLFFLERKVTKESCKPSSRAARLSQLSFHFLFFPERKGRRERHHLFFFLERKVTKRKLQTVLSSRPPFPSFLFASFSFPKEKEEEKDTTFLFFTRKKSNKRKSGIGGRSRDSPPRSGMESRIRRYYSSNSDRSSSSVSMRMPCSFKSAAVTPSPGTHRPENVPS